MLRLRHFRWTLFVLSIAWASFFLHVLWDSSVPSSDDKQQEPPQHQHAHVPSPKRTTRGDYDWSRSNDNRSVMSLPKVGLIATDRPRRSLPVHSERRITRPIRRQNQTRSLGVCETPPAQGVQDGGLMGFQVLRRMQFFLRDINMDMDTNQTQRQSTGTAAAAGKKSPSILCVLGGLTGAMRSAVLETYGKDCNGIAFPVTPCDESTTARGCQGLGSSWKVINVARNQTTVYQIGAKHDTKRDNETETETFSEYQEIFRFMLGLMDEYTWIHWASPDRYVVPDFMRLLLRAISDPDSRNGQRRPMVLESWVMDDPGQSKYNGLYGERVSGSCDSPRTFNEQTVSLLAHNCSVLLKLSTASNLTMWIDSCLSMHKPQCQHPELRSFHQAPWRYLQRYYQVQLPAANKNKTTRSSVDEPHAISSLHRYHAIIHGLCDPVWDRPLGALDKDGKPGYIHDPKFLQRNPLPFTFLVANETQAVCDIAPGGGEEGKAGYKGLSKIRIASDDAPLTATRKRVLCMVYTHSSRHERLRAVAETWGPRCDGFMAASDQTDETIGAVNLLHEGPEHYRNMWLKVRAIWRYAYDHYRDDYDFFHIGGDDHYVIAENLRHAVSTGSWKGAWNDSEPLYLGGSLALNEKRRYCNGGSGYTLNRVALEMLVEDLFPTPRCWPHWRASDEDKIVASCFRSVGIQCMDTNDDKNETRYHTWNADQHTDWRIGKPAQDWALLPNNHGIAWKEGLGQISETSVSFHLKKKEIRTIDSGMRRYHAILYGLCSNLTTNTSLGIRVVDKS